MKDEGKEDERRKDCASNCTKEGSKEGRNVPS
jgi:hypothetical protein